MDNIEKNELDTIKDKPKVKVYLEDVDISAIAMTSGAGACSLMNDPYIMKAKDKKVVLTEEEIEILKEIGEYDEYNEYINLSSDKNVDKSNKQEQIGEDAMDEAVKKALEDENAQLKKELDDLKKVEKELKITKIEKTLEPFDSILEKELKAKIVNIMYEMEDEEKDDLMKAFASLKDFEVVKKVEDNPLAKALQTEAGADGEAEVVVKDINTRIKEAREKIKK